MKKGDSNGISLFLSDKLLQYYIFLIYLYYSYIKSLYNEGKLNRTQVNNVNIIHV